MKKQDWNTHRTIAYTHDVANHPPSTGGVHHHQVRKIDGHWFARVAQSNGSHTAYGNVVPIPEHDGEANYHTAWAMEGGSS